jgi:spore coat polysaccharide biosynthesis predicted glycosyltransferase SpsG
MVTFGGGSDFGASERLLPPILDTFPELEIEVVTTRSNENLPRIEAQAERYQGRLMLTVEPEEIGLRMCEAGAALTAGGTTTVELAALGIPFITVAVAGNQELPSKAWEDRGISLHAGNLHSEMVVESVLAHLRRLVNNPDECMARSHRGRECVDGLGAQRILNHMTEGV